MRKIISILFGISLILLPCLTQAQQNSIDTLDSSITLVEQDYASSTTLVDGTENSPQVENQYQAILAKKTFKFNIIAILKGLLGMLAIMFIAWIFSVDRKNVDWGTVGKGLLIQVIIAVSVLLFGPVQEFFNFFGQCFVAVLDWTKAGSEFLFGSLLDMSKFGYIFALQILPTIIFFSALMSLLFYLGKVQKIVWVMAWLMSKAMRLSGAESLATAGNIFLDKQSRL